MSFWKDIADEVRTSVSIHSLIGCAPGARRVQCPFHHSTRPDLAIKPESGRWRCFGKCDDGAWKDVIDWVAIRDGSTRLQALRQLAKELGIMTEGSVERSRILGLAVDHYEKLLQETPAVRSYLLGRGFDEGLLMRSRIGYADGSPVPTLELSEQIKVGLYLRQHEMWRTWFDRHIVLPVWDHRAELVHMQGRAFGVDRTPKYLALHNTDIELRGPRIDRLAGGAHHINSWYGKRVYLAEGWPDRLTLDGVQLLSLNVFGHGGLDRLGHLMKWIKELVVVLDPDPASQTEQLFQQLYRLQLQLPQLSIKTLVINDEGLDLNAWFLAHHPGPISLANHGDMRDRLEDMADTAPPLFDILCARWAASPVMWYHLAQVASAGNDPERSISTLATHLDRTTDAVRFLVEAVDPRHEQKDSKR